MNIIEALTLCRDEGKLVRPACWPDGQHVKWYAYASGGGTFITNGKNCLEYSFGVRGGDELLGKWKVKE